MVADKLYSPEICSMSFAGKAGAEQHQKRRHDFIRRVRTVLAIPISHPVYDAQREQTCEFGVTVDDAAVPDPLSDKSGRGRTDPCPAFDHLLPVYRREGVDVGQNRTGANLAEEPAHVGLQVDDKLV